MNKEHIDFSWLDETIEKTGRSGDKVIPLLQAVQRNYNYLPQKALEYLCSKTDITPSAIAGVSTFYSQFRHRPAGQHTVNVCVGTACHVKGAGLVYDALHRHLKCSPGDDTDPEKMFTLQKVSCLGCCTLAPVVQIDNVTYGYVTSATVPEILEDFIQKTKNRAVDIESAHKSSSESFDEIRIGMDSCCVAAGSDKIIEAARSTVRRYSLPVSVKQVGCVGMCYRTPMMEIICDKGVSTFYSGIAADDVPAVILHHFKPSSLTGRLASWVNNAAETFLKAEPVRSSITRYTMDVREKSVQDFMQMQVHIAIEHCGAIDPVDIDEYIQKDGFKALKKCLDENNPSMVIDLITGSGLRGRGGAGFSTGLKWKLVRENVKKLSYVVCNGDEGDPGAFMDRMLLESYPYRIIEGLIIAAFAVGAHEGILYIRAEYPFAIERISEALDVCKSRGIVGNNVMDSGYSVDLRIVEGAGAFVCGEETALLKSIEGKRGMPSFKPPYPAQQGLWGAPTLVNNCETLACVPWIIRNGAQKFSSIGTAKSAGTKVFSLAGKVRNGGLIEIPMGITIREIVEKIGGGIAGDRKFKAVQIGGPSGGCIPAQLSDIPVDYEELVNAGAMMGSGGMVVLDESDCMVDIARYFLGFTQSQSCGRCTFCRTGTRRMLDILDKICTGRAVKEDLTILESLAETVRSASLCGLGKTAPNPVLTTLKYFRNEYNAHLRGECPAGKCKDLISYIISSDCNGCTICSQNCPVEAIPFTPYKQHSIDNSLCTKCDACRAACPVGAIKTVPGTVREAT